MIRQDGAPRARSGSSAITPEALQLRAQCPARQRPVCGCLASAPGACFSASFSRHLRSNGERRTLSGLAEAMHVKGDRRLMTSAVVMGTSQTIANAV